MGFFNLGALPDIDKPRAQRLSGCHSCNLDRSGKDAQPVGDGKDGILILCDYPRKGEGNDERSIFSCKHYDRLWNTQGKRGLPGDWLESAKMAYVVPCQCPNGTAKDTGRAYCCKDRLDRIIEEFKPRVIIPMGPMAIQALIWPRLEGRIKNVKPSEFYGKTIPDRHYNCWICPTYDPLFLEERLAGFNPDRAPLMYFQQHLRIAYSYRDTPLPEIPKDIRTTDSPDEAADWIDDIVRTATAGQDGVVDVAIDYETTGLKPHREGHRIVAASVAWRTAEGYHAIGFRWWPDSARLVDAWHRLTHSDRIGLIAHKADYEMTWTRFRAGLNSGRTDWPLNWSWDTCLAAHVIENNQQVGLKLHTYCELGVLGYDTKADKFLSTLEDGEDPKSCNSFNLLHGGFGVPWGEVTYYCAQDSLYSIYIRDRQQDELAGKRMGAFRFFMEGMVALAKVQAEGLPIDMGRVAPLMEDLKGRKEAAVQAVMTDPSVARWKAVHPGEEFNPASNVQLCQLLYDVLQLTPPHGSRDTKEETLEKLDCDVCRNVLLMRRWAKVMDFLDGYVREAVWDEEKGTHLIRPFFNLSSGASTEGGGPSTYRTSSSAPNFQNIPKRDKEMKKILRSLFVAPPGWRYMECDYKALETYISVAYNKDPQLLAYLKDPSLDMHKRAASLVFGVTPDEVTKDMRQQGKKWNFSSFYGSGFKNSAAQIWKDCTPEMKAVLKERVGVKNLQDFEGQCKKAYDTYWGKDFKVYDKWRKEQWQIYQRMGYLTSYYGFQYFGPMIATNAMNCCIQGTGAHCLLEGLIGNLRDFDRLGLQSRIIGEIHDSIVILAKDEEVEQVCSLVYRNNVANLNDKYAWIPLPLVEECDLSASGGTWAKMEECGACCADGLEDKSWRDKFAEH